MNFYPYNAPIILTDDIFLTYGGDLSLATTAQRQAAYWMAEEKASEDIGSLLLPTIITGTYLYTSSNVILEHAYVHYVSMVRFMDFEDDIYFTATGTSNVYFNLYDKEYGLLDIGSVVANCRCHSSYRQSPYKIQVVYQAGLYSGTSFRPDVLMGLSTYATIILNEIIGYGNESPGDIGVEQYSNQSYSEKRKGLVNNVFGHSAKANFAHRMFTRLRRMRHVGI